MNEFKKIKFIDTNSQLSLRAAAIMKIGDKFVFVKNEGKDKFKLPGGHLLTTESFAAGLKRELHEELNLELKVPEEANLYDYLELDNLIVITGYFILAVDEQIDLSKAHLPVKLFSLVELNAEPVFENELQVLSEFANSKT